MRRAGDLLAMVLSRFGLGGALLALLAFGAWYLFGTQQASRRQVAALGALHASDEHVQFAAFVLDDVQLAWEQNFPKYRRAKLVIFSGATSRGCGFGARATGPFYCPRDGSVYLDLAFLRSLGGEGEFAQAYVIAHEIGHHVQRQLGFGSRAGGASIEVELQADCFAGLWAHWTDQTSLFEGADLARTLAAAEAIGGQKVGRGTVRPETWDHGSPAQRAVWFLRGFRAGDPRACAPDATAAR